MQVNLYELLQRRPLIHPTRIKSILLIGHEMRLAVEGYPWWSDDWPKPPAEIDLLFRGIAEGHLDLGELCGADDEALEGFSILPVSDCDWAQPREFKIYCSKPLSDPLALYASLEDHLRLANASRTARDFLNVPGGLLTRFDEITSSNAYLLATAPESIRRILVEELERRSVPYDVFPTRDSSPNRYLVRLGNASFTCEEALADFG